MLDGKFKISYKTIKNNDAREKHKRLFTGTSRARFTEETQLNQLYKPILSPSFKNLKERIFSSTFFPHKKPFMQLWTFPLLGGCLVSFMMFQKNGTSTFGFQNHLDSNFTPENSVFFSNKFSQNDLKTNLPFSAFTKKSNLNFLEIEKRNLEQTTNNFETSFPNKDVDFSILKTSSLPEELNHLCFVYLNLLNNHFQSSISSLPKSETPQEFFHENFFFKYHELKRKNFLWSWHRLNSNFLTNPSLTAVKPNPAKLSFFVENKMVKNSFFSGEFSRLPQKMKTPLLNSNEGSFPFSFEKNLYENPVHSYFQSSSLFDHWVKKGFLDFLKMKSLKPNLQSTKNAPFSNFEFLNFLEEFYFLEQKAFLKSKTKENTLHSFSMLLNTFHEHENNLKNLYFQMLTTKPNSLEKQETNIFSNKRGVENVRNSEQSRFVLNLFEAHYKNCLKKIWLKHTLKTIQDQSLFTGAKTFQIKSPNASSLQTSLKSYPTFSSNLEKTVFLKLLKPKKQEPKNMVSLFERKFLLPGFLKPEVKNTLLKPRNLNTKDAPKVHKITDKEEKNFYGFTKELIFLQGQKMFPKNDRLVNHLNLSSLRFKNPQDVAKLDKFGFDKKNFTDNFLNLTYELELYYKAKKLAQKILFLSQTPKNADFHKTYLKNPILKYENPILLANSLGNKLNSYPKPNSNRKTLFFQNEKASLQNFSSFQIHPKQTHFQNRFILEKKSSFALQSKWMHPWKLFNSRRVEFKPFFQNQNASFPSFAFQQGNKQLLWFSVQKFERSPVKPLKIVKQGQSNRLPEVYFGIPVKSSRFQKENTKMFKKKTNRSLKVLQQKFQNRKAEKIFRTYLSIKAIENNSKTNLFNLKEKFSKKESVSFQKTFPMFQKLKSKIQTQKSSFRFSLKFLLMKKPLQKHGQKVHKNQMLDSQNLLNLQPNMESKSFSKTTLTFHFLKKANLSPENQENKRFSKKHDLQKKRRLKKLKLENRRRKKRKRFYPRPTSLRFQLYHLFLKKRHPQDVQNFPLKTEENQKSVRIQEKIYRQKKQRWGNGSLESFHSEKNSLRTGFANSVTPVYHEQEFYKISNETLTEFERLCWKSYWLRSNLNPYIRRIQKNFEKMQHAETFKQTNFSIFQILNNLSPYFPNSFVLDSNFSQKLNFQPFKCVTPAYLNIKETLDDSFLKTLSFTHFKQLEQKAEYNRLIYERILDEIKNVKSQLNLDGQNHARSYKSGRQKVEKPVSKSFFDGLHSLKSSQDPKIEAFSIFSTPNDASIKPFGDLPTLRLLWACQKTNLFASKENNPFKNLWSIYKKKEQTKNNKTKKFLYKHLKFHPFHGKNLESLSIDKTKIASKKIQSLGGFVYGKNYSFYLRSLKDKLKISKQTASQAWPKEKISLNSRFFQKPQKRITYFWWSSQQLNPIDQIFSLWVSAPMNFPTFQDYVSENRDFSAKLFDSKKTSRFFNFFQISTTTAFWLSCLLFHVSILFCFIRIPEIRSLAKFQLLILSKFTHLYLLSLFSIYDLLKSYKRKLLELFKKTFEVSQKRVSPSFGRKMSTNGFFHVRGKLPSTFFSEEPQNNLFVPFYSKKGSEKSFIQTNLLFTLEFREFLNFSSISKKFELLNTIFPNHWKLFSFLTFYSVSPFVQTYPKILPKKKVPETKNSLEKNSNHWIYSWYTGFLWATFKKDFQKENFQKKQSFVSKKNVTNVLNTDFRIQGSRKEEEKNLNSKNVYAFNPSFSRWTLLNIQGQSILSLSILALAKFSLQTISSLGTLFSQGLFKGIDFLESILLIFYKFFEKPAELMVDWIAEIFLVEWASDATTYLPEAFDTQLHQAMVKMSRSLRLGLGGAFPFGFFVQRLFFYSTENIYRWMLKPDMDLSMRQKKGIIFWDIWGEILLQAAEKYKMNLSSLSTVKEEQDLLIENLIEQKTMFPMEISRTRSKTSLEKNANRNFKNSDSLRNSFTKLTPLLKYLQIYPSSFSKSQTSNLFESFSPANQVSLPFVSEFNPIALRFFKKEFQNQDSFSENFRFNTAEKRWAVNQYLTTQGRDTDLFMDIHPPKSFLHISFLKTYLPAQEILGSFVCDIYSNLFSQKVSKNILVVGAPGTSKSAFIQALAGETELKMVTDNAHRYAFVQGGVPVGMKLLRDVFDSIALHTPCLFLLEDIHIIGERRPMLISDDENSKVNNATFGAEQEEVHEQNKLIYQLSRHSLSHYKRPYKGDFSLSLPTNHFSYDLFLGLDSSKKRRSDLTAKSPFAMTQLEKNLPGMEQSNQEDRFALNQEDSKNNLSWLSALQISADQVFAPPATSPFSILLMKEQKKLKPKKVVKQIPWSGFSYDQFMLISKSNYSVRVKVALLAELAMTNVSVKLDMITDLLVIIDSVRSNRGFVVFATTHLPSVLDPALRRPGRLDETISLPLLPNFTSRFEVFKTQLSSYGDLVDWFDYSLWTGIQKQNENQLSNWISKRLLLLLNTKNSKSKSFDLPLQKFSDPSLNDYPIYSLSQALQANLNFSVSFLNASKLLRSKVLNKSLTDSKTVTKGFLSNFLQNQQFSKFSLNELLRKRSQDPLFSGNDKTQYLSFSYGQSGQFLVEALLLSDQTTYGTKFWKTKPKISNQGNTEEFLFKMFYSSNEASHMFLQFFAGKMSEFFVLNDFLSFLRSLNSSSFQMRSNSETRISQTLKPGLKQLSFESSAEESWKKDWWFTNPASLPTNPSQSSFFDYPQTFQNTWQSATSFLEGFFQKRYLYQKNTIVSKLLFFEDVSSLRDSPSPPNSSILMPAKKFENYKRTLKNFIQKPMFTIQEKIQMHQKQRFLKMLYNVKIQTQFSTVSNQSQPLKENLKMWTPFSNSFSELGYLDLMTLKPTSSYASYKNHLLTRHRFSFLNQWWNGQLAEHNVETTYLSHVDWRSMFVQSLGDITIDFPDAEQYYNPRLRRWFLHSSSWDYWLSFEKNFKHEIIQQSMLKSMVTLFNVFDQNRELLDSLAFSFLRSQNLKEIHLISALIRFYQTP